MLTLMHEVPCVLVFVPLGELGPVLPVALVPVTKEHIFLNIYETLSMNYFAH